MNTRKVLAAAFAGCVGYFGLLAGSVAHGVGTDAVVTVEVQENGDVEVTSTKDLSNVHIATCVDGEVKIVKFDSLDDKVEVFDVDGTLIAVLAHSGNNTKAEAEALLTSLGGTVNGNSTGAIAFYDEDALEDCTPPTTTPPTTTPPTTTPPTTTPPTTTPPVTTPPVTQPRAPTGTVTVGGAAPVHCVTPDGHPYTTDTATGCKQVIEEPAAPAAPAVDVAAPEALAHTGSAETTALVFLGLGAVLAGIVVFVVKNYVAKA